MTSNEQEQRGNPGSLFQHEGRETDQQHQPQIDDHISSVHTDADEGSAASGLREHNILRKFLGIWRKISGDEWQRCDITLRGSGHSSNLFFKLNNEREGHFAELDANNLKKIHLRHTFGFATFTMDHSEKYLTEENHSDGTNWVWTVDMGAT